MFSETPQICSNMFSELQILLLLKSFFLIVQVFHSFEANKTAGQPTNTWDLVQ